MSDRSIFVSMSKRRAAWGRVGNRLVLVSLAAVQARDPPPGL